MHLGKPIDRDELITSIASLIAPESQPKGDAPFDEGRAT
jgi:hypothetical protein